MPLFVGRAASITALEEAVADGNKILLVAQKNSSQDDLTFNDIYSVGTIGNILQLLRLADGSVKVLVEGQSRARIESFADVKGYMRAIVSEPPVIKSDDKRLTALVRSVMFKFEEYIKLNHKMSPEVIVSVSQIEDPEQIANAIASHITLKTADKQNLLEKMDLEERVETLLRYMEREISILKVEKKIYKRVKSQIDKNQKEYYLNEQMKAIQAELGEEDELSELDALKKKIKETKLSAEAKEKAESEWKKLKNMNLMSPEATVIRNYLDWLLGVPWNKKSKQQKSLAVAEKILNNDHFGLEKVKERIVEYIASTIKSGKIKGPILCLVGPPGVGKTSLGESIARATGRNFVRISLGGVRDEAEIRGHRRTYIGSMPGKIIQGMKKAKVSNPLFLLDEVDKLGNDWKGDPSSALLEVLDPEQNHTFNDHYLEVDFDLSNVMFITTANTMDMPRPLLDRMEVIRLSGYTEEEKIQIAKRHLIPKLLEAAGLQKKEWKIDDDALQDLIRLYTAEAGVRNLERELSKLIRKATKQILTDENVKSVRVTKKNLKEYAGIQKYTFGIASKKDLVGVTTGLAWTEVGGDILSIEALKMAGKGNVILTGRLGDVMKESITAAHSFVKAKCLDFGIRPDIFEKTDIHIHVPEGATPKDGPSAGIAMFTSLVSALTGIKVRKDVAMTGEITLIGRILPIGGLKEKLLAALRGGITTVIIPKENEKDLEEMPENVLKGLTIIPLERAQDVLKVALTEMPSPISLELWEKESKFLPTAEIVPSGACDRKN
jgi:ATP-dependent Lon protease